MWPGGAHIFAFTGRDRNWFMSATTMLGSSNGSCTPHIAGWQLHVVTSYKVDKSHKTIKYWGQKNTVGYPRVEGWCMKQAIIVSVSRWCLVSTKEKLISKKSSRAKWSRVRLPYRSNACHTNKCSVTSAL